MDVLDDYSDWGTSGDLFLSGKEPEAVDTFYTAAARFNVCLNEQGVSKRQLEIVAAAIKKANQ